jgi:hypothetical protein
MSTLIRRLAWSRLANPKVAVSLSAAGLLLGMLLGATSPNAETIGVRLPLSVLPSLAQETVLASLMLYASLVLAGAGLAGMMWAHSQGWRPNPRYLLLAAVVIVGIMVCLTPVGSSDVASYSAYGRIAAQGGNPYTTGPAAWGDPAYTNAVGTMWRNQPSVYGPVATVMQAFAATIGRGDVNTTVWVWMILNGLVFIGVGVLLLLTSDDPVRATLFWTVNPVLILALVSGGHLDTFVAAFAIGAIQVARKMPTVWGDVLAGVLVGLGCGVKIYAVLIGAGLAWPLLTRREWRRLAVLTGTILATLVIQYSFYGVSALKPVSGGLALITPPSPWSVFRIAELWGAHYPNPTITLTITILWPIALLVVAWLVYQRISADQPREVVAPFALTYAWVLVAPWVFAWYTAVAWVALTQVPRNRMTRWLTLVTVFLGLCLSSGGHATPGT